MPKLNQHFRDLSIRFTLGDNGPRGTPLTLPSRNTRAAAIIVGIMFVVFAAILVTQAGKLNLHPMGSVFDLMTMLFSLFWLIGWSVGVLVLGLLTVILLFVSESAWVVGGRLHHALTVGALSVSAAYELALMSKLEVEPDGSGEQARVRFDYGGLRRGLGDLMPLEVAERNVNILRNAMGTVTAEPSEDFARPAEFAQPPKFVPPAAVTQRRMPLTSMLTLIAANLLPLLGVVSGDWTLEEVVVLFWAESAVIGFFTLLKIAVVAKWWALFPGLFFIGHFGGFMAIHFLFIYELFVRGIHAKTPEPHVVEALTPLFTHLWTALLALFVSHGVSFALNFIARREYEGAKVASLMQAPYGRIVVMQFTVILGGWVVMLLHDPVPATALLIVLKIVADLRAHYAERNPKISGG